MKQGNGLKSGENHSWREKEKEEEKKKIGRGLGRLLYFSQPLLVQIRWSSGGEKKRNKRVKHSTFWKA